MDARSLRRQVLLSTTMLVGTLIGYGRRAYAACPVTVAPNYLCSGANVATITINANNATVSTDGTFSVNAAIGNALEITGDGALVYTDANASPLTAPSTALYVRSNGDAGAVPGSVAVDTNGILTGGTYGIFVRNFGTGALTVTADGDVEGTNNFGIYARNVFGTDLTVTTGAGTTVMSDNSGIDASNTGSGATTVIANGDVTGIGNLGIFALNFGTDLAVTTGAGTTVLGGTYGIYAQNLGYGATTVTANGDVTGTNFAGIYAGNRFGTDLSVTTAGGTTVTGATFGIDAAHYGSGVLTVTANGDVTGGTYGIRVRNINGTDVSVTTGAGTTVMGGTSGVYARNYGSGALSVTANGDVTGTTVNGIYARNEASATDLGVTTGAGTTVMGGNRGIDALNYGGGKLTVTAKGDVTGTNIAGIVAQNVYGTDLSVTTAGGTTVTGGLHGIFATNTGSGATTVTVNGDVTGTNANGIFARNVNAGTDVSVVTGVNSNVTGATYGIDAINYGSGALSVTANGDVTSTFYGIGARNVYGTDLTVTTGAGTTVMGGNTGVFARNYGSGALTVTPNGDVTGTANDGIYARHDAGGPIVITIGAATHVTSNGAGADDFALDISGGPGDVTVGGTLNGGGGGAVQFDQVNALNDRLELHPTAAVNGTVFAGPGSDSFVLGGTGTASFDVSLIGAGQQYQDFEIFEKEDGSHWTLTGTNTTIDNFAVNGGLLSVNGSLPNAVFSVNAGTLGGIGTVGATTVFGGGILAPGTSIGTLTVNGNFTLNPGAIFEVEANAAGQADKVVVTGNGTVNLTGSVLRVLAQNGDFNPRTDYLIVDNDGVDPVNGQFAKVTTKLVFLTPVVLYDAGDGNDVVLSLLVTAPPGGPGGIHASIAGILADESRYVREAVLGRLMQASYTNNAGQVASLGASGPQVASLDSRAMTLGSAGAPANAAPAYGPGLAFWTRAYGAWADFDGNKNAASASRDLGGFLSGVDARVGGTWRLGLAAGFAQSDIGVDALHSAAEVESFNLAGYAGGMAGPLALRGGGAWAFQDIDTSRASVAPGFFERENASYNGDTGQIFGEVAYPTSMGSVALEPFAGLAFVSVETGSFKERGGALTALNSSGIDMDVGYSTLGLRAASTMHVSNMAVTPHVSAAWQHAFDGVTPGAALVVASSGVGFTVFGVPLAENSLLVEAGLDLNLSPTATLGVSYSGQFASEVEDNAVKGRFTWLF